ncbi:MAG: serine/threonine-protein kinase [Salinivenus sp.]
MPEDRWDKVGRLLGEVREADPERREALLETRCDDPELRAEVRSLLEAEKGAEDFFGRLGATIASFQGGADGAEDAGGEGKPVSDPLELEGTRVGQYEVQAHLGGGGMGIVYRARDPELDRPVALKFLPPHLTSHPEAEKRFVQEAKAAAALGHPNIATVHEIGRTESGRRYIAMAYYEGETLKKTIEREGALPVETALRYAEQVAEALSAAHEAGIVHRDVKPANVMVTESGAVKLLDFGLAQAEGGTGLTETGRRLGTAAYMSPEQVRGEDVDPRTDLWAVGALLYEMGAGERPFEGERRAAVLYAVVHEEPTPLAERRPELPAALARLVHRCLRKDPADRYASAAALREDLQAVASGEETASIPAGGPGPLDSVRGARRWVLGVAAVLVLALIGALGWALRPVGEADVDPSSSTVAVLPFEVSGSGTETWRNGMVTALSMNLDGAAGLRAVAARTVLAAWERHRSSDGGTESALTVARDVGAKYAIVGSAVQLGGELRLAAEVHGTTTSERLGKVEVRGRPDSVTALTDRLTRHVLEVLLQRSEERIPSVNLASVTTRSLPAFKAFLEGERHLRAGAYGAAARDFERAAEQDSSFALAYARLERALAWSGGEDPVRALRRACKLSDRLPLRDRRLVRSRCRGELERREMAVVDTLRRMTEDYPQDPQVWYNLGEALFHGWVPGGWRESEEAFRRAVQLDSGAAPYQHHLDDLALALHRDSARTIRQIENYPERQLRRMYQGFSTLIFGAPRDRQTAWARLDTLSLPNTSFPYWVRWPFLNPKDLDLQNRVIRQIGRRENVRTEPYMELLAENHLLRGRVEALRPLLRSEANREEAGCLLAVGRTLQYPVPDSLLRAHLEPATVGTNASANQLLCVGLYLIDQGRTEEIPELMTRLKETIAESTEESERARNQMRVVSNELRGYRAWRAGRLERAAQFWSASKWSWWWWGGATSALWRGDLYRELGALRKAEEWYNAAWPHPVAHERLGRLYQKTGRPEKAVAAYRRFVDAWNDADPELQDRVAAARKRLTALGGGRPQSDAVVEAMPRLTE